MCVGGLRVRRQSGTFPREQLRNSVEPFVCVGLQEGRGNKGWVPVFCPQGAYCEVLVQVTSLIAAR